MAEFTQEQKEFVVDALADGKGLTEVANLMVTVFGKEAFPKPPPTSQIARYDLDCAACSLGDELLQRFKDRREARLNGTGDKCLISSPDFRLRELLDLYQRNKARGADVLAAKFLEQAAKERGGMYERPSDGLTPEDVATIVERRLKEALAAVAEHVTNPEERERVSQAIKEKSAGRLAGGGEGGG